MPKPSKPEWESCTETEITVKWNPNTGCKYKLRWMDCTHDTGSEAEDWAQNGQELVTELGASQATAPDLQPTSTYLFKLIEIDSTGNESEPSDVATIDTQVANCTPEPKGCCTLM